MVKNTISHWFIITSTLILVSLFNLDYGYTQSSGEVQSHHQWSFNLGMYEVNLRHYSQEGNIAAFKSDLVRNDSLGPGIIWFMRIHPIEKFKKIGSLRSPFYVKDF